MVSTGTVPPIRCMNSDSAHELGPPNIAEPLVECDIKALSIGREARTVRTSRWIVEVDTQTCIAALRGSPSDAREAVRRHLARRGASSARLQSTTRSASEAVSHPSGIGASRRVSVLDVNASHPCRYGSRTTVCRPVAPPVLSG